MCCIILERVCFNHIRGSGDRGEILGNRYKLLRDLRSEGRAWVYRAEDSTARELVAVKAPYSQTYHTPGRSSRRGYRGILVFFSVGSALLAGGHFSLVCDDTAGGNEQRGRQPGRPVHQFA